MQQIESGVVWRGLLSLAFAIVATTVVGAQERATGLKLSGDEPIQIESDKLEVRENESIAVFTGNVSVVQGKTLLKSGKMTVHYTQGEGGSTSSGSSDIERLEVEGKVYVKSETQEATGDRGTYDMATEILTLTGDRVVLTEGPNVVVGCKLVVHTRTGLANLEGCKDQAGASRVKMLLQPQSQQR